MIDTEPKKESVFNKYGRGSFQQQPPAPPPSRNPIAQQVASSPFSQLALGGIELANFPLEAASFITDQVMDRTVEDYYKRSPKFQGRGETPEDQEALAKEMEATKQYVKSWNYIPAMSKTTEYIKREYGVDLDPQDVEGRLARKIPLFVNIAGLVKGGATLGSNLFKAGLGSALSETLSEMGAPPLLSDAAGAFFSGALHHIKREAPKLTSAGIEAQATAAEHELPKLRGAIEDVAAGEKATLPVGKKEEIAKELGTSSERAIQKLVKERFPKATQEAPLIEAESTAARRATLKTAAQEDAAIAAGKKEPISTEPLVDWIDDHIEKIRSEALDLGEPAEKVIKILKKARSRLEKGKTITPSQAVKQVKEWNDNTRAIYQKPEAKGAEKEIISIYEELKDKLANTLKQQGQEVLADNLAQSNRLFSEARKLEKTQELLEPFFKEGYKPKEFAKFLQGNGGKELTKSLGEKRVGELRRIANYGKRAHERVLERIKNPQTVGDYIKSLTPLKAMLLAIPKALIVKLAIGGYQLSKALSPRATGKLLINPKTSKAYEGFLKAAAQGGTRAFALASKELTQAINEEYGSEEEFLKSLEEEAEDLTTSSDLETP